MCEAYLKVIGNSITLNGRPVQLCGTALGGWMNMENFITGYPGHEHQMREAMLDALGEERYDYFFEQFLTYFFQEKDAEYLASLGLNCLRLPVNYRHFEDDMNPRVFKNSGFKHLDRVVELCAKHGIYTIIDLHSAPGGQNIDWHCDAGGHQALFWEHLDFQDRTILLWEHIARHYKDNTWVAGYNPLNEPTDSKQTRLVGFYNRLEKAVRAVDLHHILFLDTFGADFSHFDKPWPNSAYDTHDYARFGFPNSELYKGTPEQQGSLVSQFERKVEWMRKHDVPIWNGEFGPVYQPDSDPDYVATNACRYHMLRDQLVIYAKDKVSWSIWTYKDIGHQGMVYAGDDTAYKTLLAPFLEKKKSICADAWGADYSNVEAIFDPLEKWIVEKTPGILTSYPKTWRPRNKLGRMIRNTLMSELLCAEYALYFADKSLDELDKLAASFAFENCTLRRELAETLKAQI